jgi:tRNA pseudouridine38-40 synthase
LFLAGNMRVVLGIEYRGSAYCGWQSQPSGCGVQDHLEKAIAAFLVTPLRVTCAGRTDTGVHATAQVVHLDTEVARPEAAWIRGVNATLPADIRVTWARQLTAPLAETFHARFAAKSRRYRYLLLNRAVAPALHQGLVGWFHAPLALAAMQEAAARVVGEHDFSTFRSAECQAKSPVKTVYEATVAQHGDLFVFDFRANAFLHHMVRNLVGSLVYVGAGRMDLNTFQAQLEARERALAPPTFSADGLCLTGVEYDESFDLPKPDTRLWMLE